MASKQKEKRGDKTMFASSQSLVNRIHSDPLIHFQKKFDSFDKRGDHYEQESFDEKSAQKVDEGNTQQLPRGCCDKKFEYTIAAKLVRLRHLKDNIHQWRVRRFPDAAAVSRSAGHNAPIGANSGVLLQTSKTMAKNNNHRGITSSILEEVRQHAAFEKKTVEQIHDATMLLMMAVPGSPEEIELMRDRNELTQTMQNAQNELVTRIQVMESITSRKSRNERRPVGSTSPQDVGKTVEYQGSRVNQKGETQNSLDNSKRLSRKLLEEINEVQTRASIPNEFHAIVCKKEQTRSNANLQDVEGEAKRCSPPTIGRNGKAVGFETPVARTFTYDFSQSMLSPAKAGEKSQQLVQDKLGDQTKGQTSPVPLGSRVLSKKSVPELDSNLGDESSTAIQIKDTSEDAGQNKVCEFDWGSFELESTDCDLVLPAHCNSDGNFRLKEAMVNKQRMRCKVSSDSDASPDIIASKSIESRAGSWTFEPSTHVKYNRYRAAKYKAAKR